MLLLFKLLCKYSLENSNPELQLQNAKVIVHAFLIVKYTILILTRDFLLKKLMKENIFQILIASSF